MKKVLLLPFVCLILLVFASCDRHEHRFSNNYSFDETEHWFACTTEECDEKSSIAAHNWRALSTEKKPSSDEEGIEIYICRDCKTTETRTVAKLPDRMPKNEWDSLFNFENVRIDIETNKSKGRYEIDGDIMAHISDLETVYNFSNAINNEIDFSENYTDFSNNGDGSYTCDKLTRTIWNLTLSYSNVCVKITNGKISEISFVTTVGSTELEAKYVLSSWGEIELTLPSLTSEELAAAFHKDNFKNVTLEYQTFNTDTSEALWLVKHYVENKYLIRDFINSDTPNVYGECEHAAEVTEPMFFEILQIITADKFRFDINTNHFVYSDSVSLSDGTTIESLLLLLEDGRIKKLTVKNENMQTHYMFREYGITQIETTS